MELYELSEYFHDVVFIYLFFFFTLFDSSFIAYSRIFLLYDSGKLIDGRIPGEPGGISRLSVSCQETFPARPGLELTSAALVSGFSVIMLS